MSSEPLVRVCGVSKKFCRSLKRSLWYGMQDIAYDLSPFRRAANTGGGADSGSGARRLSENRRTDLRHREFWALSDISFQLRRGECLGLIGHNGAGKTTLLKMLNGLIKPDRGLIEIHGRVGGLIALGAGFNPILTGRENIYVNGSILGLRKKELDEKVDAIIDFAEIRDFIDTPVQSYSAGMHVRLGFAIASAVEPDVLLLDEVLAVGDIGFVVKCLNRMRTLAPKAAVIFVSHNMQFVSNFCTRVLVLEKGRVLLDAANPAEGIDRYYAMIDLENQVSGTGEAQLLRCSLVIDGVEFNDHEPSIPQQSVAFADLSLRIAGPRRGAYLSVYIHDEATTPVVCIPVIDDAGDPLCLKTGQWHVRVPLGRLELNSGKYSFVIALRDADTHLALCRHQGVFPFRIFASKSQWGKVVRPTQASIAGIHGQ